MAATALQLNSETIGVESYQNKVEALTDVITRHMPRFYRIAVGRLSNAADAEDAVQDALLLALRHVQQFRGQAKMSTWLTTIVINSARMKLRKRLAPAQMAPDEMDGRRELVLENIVLDTRPDPEQAYCTREIAETLSHAISLLSPTLRTTYRLRDVCGLSIRETADRLGVPTGTVKARLGRARMRLRKLMLSALAKSREG